MMKTMNMPSKIETRQSKPGEGNVRRAILHPPSSILNPRHRGFSFAEVMFAVVILGIGFIMVAAVFPVAIQQTQATGEENIAAALARQAADSITQMPTTMKNPAYSPTAAAGSPESVQTILLFPPTVKPYIRGTDTSAPAAPAVVVPFTGNRWDMIKSNVILPSDPRYAYVMFYKRDNGSSAAQLIVVAVANRNRPVYDPSKDLTATPASFLISTVASDIKAASVAPGTSTLVCPDAIQGSFLGRDLQTQIPSVPELSYFEVPAVTGPFVSPAGRSYSIGPYDSATTPKYAELLPGDGMALTAGSTGLWGTTAASGNPPVAPALPINDTAATGTTSANLYPTSTLQPTVAYATLQSTPDAPAGRILLRLVPPTVYGGPTPPAGAVPGAYVIIADDFPYDPAGQAVNRAPQDYNLPDNVYPNYSVGALNGRIFRLGQAATTDASGGALSPGTFNLDPTYGMRPAGASGYSPDTIPNPDMVRATSGAGRQSAARVYIIGAGRTDPTTSGSSAPVSGPAQDIGVFASFFQVQ